MGAASLHVPGQLCLRLRDVSIDGRVFAQEAEELFVQSLPRGFVVEAVAFLRLHKPFHWLAERF